MVYADQKRKDYLGLSTDDKPTYAVNGDTYYEVDTGEFFIYFDGTWYEQE